MSGRPTGFAYQRRAGGDVLITHHGKPATTLRGDAAADFLDDMATCSHDAAQDVMARLTGNYRRGNERLAKNHPRNS